MTRHALLAITALVFAAGCPSASGSGDDLGAPGADATAASDAGTSDGGTVDLGSGIDAAPVDAALEDAALEDAAFEDAALEDAAPEDAAPDDAAHADAGLGDAEAPDAMASPPPVITTFTADPALLPRGGGAVTLAWAVTGATQLSVAPGVGDVTGQTMTLTTVTTTTTFTLTAVGPGGVDTATVTVRMGALFVDPVGGDDAASGLRTQPLRTIGRAASLAQTGDTVYLLDGTHEIPFVRFRPGITLRAVNVGGARVQLLPATNGALIFDGSADLHGFDVTSNSAFGFFQVSQGTLRVEALHYTAPGPGTSAYPLVAASGTAQVELVAPADGEWCPTQCNTPFVAATDDARVVVTGGRLRNFTQLYNLFSTGGRAALTLRDLTIRDGSAQHVVALGNSGLGRNDSQVRLERVTIRGVASLAAVLVGFGASSLVVDSSTIADNPGVGVEFDSNGNYTPAVHTATIARSVLARNLIGLREGLYARARVVLDTVEVRGNTQSGLACRFTAEGCWLDVRGGLVAGGGDRGLDAVTEGNKVNRVRLRGVTVRDNVGIGVDVTGLPGSLWDLGTPTSPGGNRLTGNGGSSVFVRDPTNPAWAVGNTWSPNVQGADALGRYAPGPGGYQELTGPVAAGANHQLVAGARLRL
jgi:hypothetical protein